jgi:hypothetical protein
MTKSFCCAITRDAIGCGDKRGMTIVPVRNSRFGDFFFLRYRAVTAEDGHKLVIPDDVAVALKIDQAIKFCPWCGAKLSEVFQENFESLPFVLDDDFQM